MTDDPGGMPSKHRAVDAARAGGARRWRTPLVVAALAALLAAGAVLGGGWLGGGWLGGSPGRPASGGYVPTDQQQADGCDGVAAPPRDRLHLLRADAEVTAAVVCSEGYADLPGRGRWQVRRVVQVPAARIPALVSALELPDRRGGTGGCSAMLVVVPDFVLTLADGSRIRPGVPGDGCHPRAEVVEALRVAIDDVRARATVPVSQIATEQQVSTGCGAEAKSPAVWLDADADAGASRRASATGLTGRLPLPPAGPVALCRYTPEGDPMVGALAATGRVTTSVVAAALDSFTATPPADRIPGCSSPHPAETAPATDWLMVQALPPPAADQPTPPPLLLVELSGCRRVIGATPLAVLGHLPAGAASALRALADHPAT